MSEGILNTQIDGTTIQAQHVNQYKTALVEDILPRNLSGTNEDEGGSLGSDIYRWLKGIISTVFTNKLSIGAAGNEATNPSLTSLNGTARHDVITGKEHRFYVNNSIVGLFASTGMDGSYLKAASVVNSAMATDSINTTQIVNLAVTEAKIGNLAVTNGKLANASVDESKLANSAVTTNRLATASVSTAKIIGKNVTAPKLAEYTKATDAGNSSATGATGIAINNHLFDAVNGETMTVVVSVRPNTAGFSHVGVSRVVKNGSTTLGYFTNGTFFTTTQHVDGQSDYEIYNEAGTSFTGLTLEIIPIC